MAEISQWTDEQHREWEEWVESRPPAVQDIARRLPPNRLYRLGTTGHRVTIFSYNEDGTVKVNVTGQYNWVTFNRTVFGINPDDLEETDLPDADEQLGSMGLDVDEVKTLGTRMRAIRQ